jgi:hypothetical protein
MENLNYSFVDELNTDLNKNCPIKILEGKYKDIIFRYGKIGLTELDSGDLKIDMEIEVLVCPEGFDQQEPDFTNIVGNIFSHIVESGIDSKMDEPIDLEDDVHQDNV